jgi:hypothetical protein
VGGQRLAIRLRAHRSERCRVGHRRTEDSRLLLDILRDEGQEIQVREAAYDALIILHRKGAGEGGWPFPIHKSGFDPTRDVDWMWIRSR